LTEHYLRSCSLFSCFHDVPVCFYSSSLCDSTQLPGVMTRPVISPTFLRAKIPESRMPHRLFGRFLLKTSPANHPRRRSSGSVKTIQGHVSQKRQSETMKRETLQISAHFQVSRILETPKPFHTQGFNTSLLPQSARAPGHYDADRFQAPFRSCRWSWRGLCRTLGQEMRDQAHDSGVLRRVAFGDQQGERHQGGVGQAGFAVASVQGAVFS
jgi:hypothetical protein